MTARDRALFALVGPREAASAPSRGGYSYGRATLRAFCRHRTALVMAILMAALILFALVQPLLPGQHPPTTIYNDAQTGLQLRNLPPCRAFPFGTNAIGQDLWARVWAGTRVSLLIGITAALAEMAIGTVMGMIWGYVRPLDGAFTALYNVVDNIPQSILLVLASYLLRPGLATLLVALCLTGWLGMARFVRNQVLLLRDRDYNVASRCLGTPFRRIARCNLLPYLVSVITLRAALTVPAAIGSEVFLTYVGLGLPAGMPSLGNLINEGRSLMMAASLRYQLIFPAAVLSLVTLGFYVVGNALADAADPRNHR